VPRDIVQILSLYFYHFLSLYSSLITLLSQSSLTRSVPRLCGLDLSKTTCNYPIYQGFIASSHYDAVPLSVYQSVVCSALSALSYQCVLHVDIYGGT
jgi:hypothetical protein